jgi:hypothetical protein
VLLNNDHGCAEENREDETKSKEAENEKPRMHENGLIANLYFQVIQVHGNVLSCNGYILVVDIKWPVDNFPRPRSREIQTSSYFTKGNNYGVPVLCVSSRIGLHFSCLVLFPHLLLVEV